LIGKFLESLQLTCPPPGTLPAGLTVQAGGQHQRPPSRVVEDNLADHLPDRCGQSEQSPMQLGLPGSQTNQVELGVENGHQG
jgi:hypothetical protein